MQISENQCYSVFPKFCFYVYKLKRMKQGTLLSVLIESSWLIWESLLCLFKCQPVLSSFLRSEAVLSIVSSWYFLRLEANNLLLQFSSATSAAHIS